MSKNRNRNNNGPRREDVFNDAEIFATCDFKKFYKKNKKKSGWDSKKEAKKEFFDLLMEKFPTVVYWMLREGFKRDQKTRDIADGILDKFADKDFVKRLTKKVQKGEDYRNLELFPIFLREAIKRTSQKNAKLRSEGKTDEMVKLDIYYDLVDELVGKKIKKLVRAGVNEDIARNLREIIPCENALRYSTSFRIKEVFDVLYDAAKTMEIPFDTIVKHVIPKEYWTDLIVISLLEKKEFYGSLNDSQKKFYVDVTNWIFKTMNEMETSDIQEILRLYVAGRKRDDANGRDCNRRYSLSTLGENEYKNIVTCIKAMIVKDPTIEKFM